MANLPQSDAWDAGIHQIETSDPVLGGVNGPANAGAKNLANRTVYLRNKLAGLGVTPTWVEVVKTATGTWTAPADVSEVLLLEMVGGGGGGAGSYLCLSGTVTGGSGGEGTRIEGVVLDVTPSTEYDITIGAAGTAGANYSDGGTNTFDHASNQYKSSTVGSDGGDTSFGALVTAPGGKGAGDTVNTGYQDYTSVPGAGGSVTLGGVTHKGEPGHAGSVTGTVVSGTKGGGRLGGTSIRKRTGASTYTEITVAPGYGCGGQGGNVGNATPQDGGAGIVRFGYFTATISGKPTAI